jgi:hypothetical protein
MTTDELRNQIIELSHHLATVKEQLAKRLVQEFPVKAGDIVTCPRTGEYLVERVSPHHLGPTLYVHRKTKKGWDIRITTVAGLESNVLNGSAPFRTPTNE